MRQKFARSCTLVKGPLSKPDWWAIAQVAQRMGFGGFDWPDSNAIFEESAERSIGTRYDYSALVDKARADGVRAHELLRTYGTTGIQGPVRLENGELTGTERLHEDLTFRTSNGRSNFVHVDLEAVTDRNELLGPNSDEFWVLTGRVNGLWQSMYDDKRKPHLVDRWPWNHIEIHPDDAERLSVASGDLLGVESDRVRTADQQTTSGAYTAVAYVTDTVQPGTVFSNFHYPGSPSNAVITGDAASQTFDPRQPYKFGRGRVRRIGPSGFDQRMSLAPRNLA